MKLRAFVVACTGLVVASSNAQINLYQIADVDISSTAVSTNAEFIGSNPSAVAWDGTRAFVGGYNASGAAANTAIAPITVNLSLNGMNQATDFTTTATFGTSFGALSTPNLRGNVQLSIKGNTLAAALDAGSGNANSIRSFDATNGNLNWRIGDPGAGNDSSRRGNGVDFDPGFGGGGTNVGIGYMSIGSGRRHVLNESTGQYINGQNAGAIVNASAAPVSNGTTWRGLTFAPNGDAFFRNGTAVTKGTRTADNNFGGSSTVVYTPGVYTTVVDNNNLEYVDAATPFVIFNERSATGSGQAAANVLKAINTSGVTQSLSLLGMDSAPITLANGNGAYAFSYASSNQTLAVTDFANRRLYIFSLNQPVPEPGTIAAVGLGAIALLRRRRSAK